MRLLQCAIKYEAGDLRGCRAALEALPPGGPAAAATAGCLAYKEGRWGEAAACFSEAMQMVRAAGCGQAGGYCSAAVAGHLQGAGWQHSAVAALVHSTLPRAPPAHPSLWPC